jgi:hypothetical protein
MDFVKQTVTAELLSDDFEMIGKAMPLSTDAVKLNKKSMKDLDKVLDAIQLSPEEMARLKQIIEASEDC